MNMDLSHVDPSQRLLLKEVTDTEAAEGLPLQKITSTQSRGDYSGLGLKE